MYLQIFFRIYLTFILTCLVSCNREKRLVEVLEGVRRIEELLNKEERLREITDIVRIDSTVDKLNKKLDIVISMLDRPSQASPRSGGNNALIPGDLSSNLEAIDNRLNNLESSVTKVEESTSKIDLYAAKIEEIESRTTQMKDDTNLKLRKMSNVMNALYEMNKDMKSNMARSDNGEQTPGGSTSNYATEFLVENLDEMERKMKEQLSVLASDLRSEISSLKMVVSTLGGNCQSTSEAEEDDDDWLTPKSNARSINPRPSSRSIQKVENTLDNLVETLGRQTREIREEIQNGMQEIDTKLDNLTVAANKKQTCDPMQASESVVRSQSVRAILPVQSVSEKKSRSETCTKSVKDVPTPKSCADLRKGGATCDGIYVIFPKGVRAVRVYCDMTTDDGGWTIVMRRGDFGDKMTSFNKNWASYKNGFGDSEGEFWLGNDVMHLMTTEDDNMLRIHMSSFDNDEVNLDYTSFAVGNESSFYRLHIGLPTGATATLPAANSLRYHNNHPFSTIDRKNDGFEQNCAATYKGGWWFNGCYFGFLTGEYFKQSDKRETWQGIMWYDWKGNQSLKGAEMMIRPKNFTLRG